MTGARLGQPGLPWPDRAFVGGLITAGLEKIDAPSLASVRSVAREVLATDPHAPLALQVHPGRVGRRRPVVGEEIGQLVDRLVVPDDGSFVVHRDEPGSTGLSSALATHRAPDTGLPFRLVVGESRVLLSAWHVIGDARIANGLLTGAILAAIDGGGVDVLTQGTTPGTARALVRSLVHGIRGAGLPRRHMLPPARAELQAPPWVPDPWVEHRSYSPEVLRSMKVASRSARVRRSSVLIARIEQALRETGLAPRDDFRTVVVDCRRYLEPGARVRGNLSAGQVLAAEWTEPRSVDAAVTGALRSARPVLGLVVACAASFRPGRRPVRQPAAMVARPTYSIMGPMPGLSRLPWVGSPGVAVGGRPGRPDEVTFAALEVGQCLQVTASFDRSVFPPGLIRAVLDLVAGLDWNDADHEPSLASEGTR